MKKYLYIMLCLSALTIMSCGECEDKTLAVSEDLLEFVEYLAPTTHTMVNQDNETMDFTISHDVSVSEEESGDCIKTFVKPFFVVDRGEQEEFIRIWASLNEDFLLGDHEQLWFIMDGEDGSIFKSGMIRNPLLTINSINLNGSVFDDVISIVITNDQDPQTAIHVQRGFGLVGFELMDETWVVQ